MCFIMYIKHKLTLSHKKRLIMYQYYVAGILAGTTGTIVSHPFFTLKVCLQNGDMTSIRKYLIDDKRMFNKLKWLYRGISPALVGYSIEKAIIFGTFNYFYALFKKQNIAEKQNAFLSGFLSGIVASFSITYFEQMTISMQQKLRAITFRQLRNGLLPTMARESIGFSIYFSVYNYLTNKYNQQRNLLTTGLIGIPSIVTAWMFITPIDKIKTNIQSNKPVNLHGLFSMYKGFTFVMLRAIPFHTTCFVVFEFAIKHMKKYGWIFEHV